MNAEITWDLVMSDDMAFAEGCYRSKGRDWQVVTAVKAQGRRPIGIRDKARWDSGAGGINIVLADDAKINARIVLAMMSRVLGITEWREVKGPDSMALR